MTGITNRPKSEEDANQDRVEVRKEELSDIKAADRPRKDRRLDKDREHDLPAPDGLADTGAGRGTQDTGH